jgi:hypothetical protein
MSRVRHEGRHKDRHTRTGESQLKVQLEAAAIERDLSQVEKNAWPIPTAQLQSLKDLDPEERRVAWRHANELAGTSQRTAAYVEQAVRALKPPTPVPFWQAMSVAHPTAHLWTQAGLSSYRSACGMTAQRAPSGSTEAGHCSRCTASPGTLAPAVELPPLPADLRAWTRWRNTDGTIGMRHPTGIKLGGKDATALEVEARSLATQRAGRARHSR